MSDKVFTPRFFSGREYETWVRNVSRNIGIDPPLTLEEVGEQSLVPIMSQLRQLESRINDLERKLSSARSLNKDIYKRVDDLERSI